MIDIVLKWNTKRRRAGQAIDTFSTEKKKTRSPTISNTERRSQRSNVASASVANDRYSSNVLEPRWPTKTSRIWPPLACNKRPYYEHRGFNSTHSLHKWKTKWLRTGTLLILFRRKKKNAFADRCEDRPVAYVDEKIASCFHNAATMTARATVVAVVR